MKNLNSIVFTDLHIKEGEEQDCIDIVNQITYLCNKNKCSNLIFAGDWFTSRKGQALSVIEATNQIVKSIKDKNINLLAIAGNHDKVDLESPNSFVKELLEGKATVFDNYQVHTIGSIRYHFIPYFKENGMYAEYLSRACDIIKSYKGNVIKNILITHIAVKGVTNNDGTKVENNLTKDLFKAFDLVLVGHYHNRQQIENIHYIGSTHPRNFGEDNNKGCVFIYDDGSIEYVDLQFKRFETLTIGADDLTPKALKSLKDKYVESNVRVRVEGEKEKVKSIDTSIFEELGLSYQMKTLDREVSIEEVIFEPLSSGQILEEFEQFSKEKQLSKKQIELSKKYLII